MPDVNFAAVAVVSVTAFLMSFAYYSVLANQLTSVSPAAATQDQPAAWMIAAELIRTIVTVTVVAGIITNLGTDTLGGGLAVGAALFVGLPLMLWIGAMLHENTSFKLAAIHAGDWLIKLLAVSTILSLWN